MVTCKGVMAQFLWEKLDRDPAQFPRLGYVFPFDDVAADLGDGELRPGGTVWLKDLADNVRGVPAAEWGAFATTLGPPEKWLGRLSLRWSP